MKAAKGNFVASVIRFSRTVLGRPVIKLATIFYENLWLEILALSVPH